MHRQHKPGEGGYSHVKAYGDVLPKWLLFQQKSLDTGPILVKKILRRGFHFTKSTKKIVKSALFEVEKPLQIGPDLRKISKKNLLNQPFFEGEKSF